jgi:hypothetical protein
LPLRIGRVLTIRKVTFKRNSSILAIFRIGTVAVLISLLIIRKLWSSSGLIKGLLKALANRKRPFLRAISDDPTLLTFIIFLLFIFFRKKYIVKLL